MTFKKKADVGVILIPVAYPGQEVIIPLSEKAIENITIIVNKKSDIDYSEMAEHIEKALKRENIKTGGVSYDL